MHLKSAVLSSGTVEKAEHIFCFRPVLRALFFFTSVLSHRLLRFEDIAKSQFVRIH